MAQPPRMLYLSAGDSEALVALPTTLDLSQSPLPNTSISLMTVPHQKAIQLATETFSIPTTHIVRLSCRASEMPIVGGFAAGEDIFL